jgi:hypothetical protein
MNPINDDLNDDLKYDAFKHALRRREAPDGFAERVLLRVERVRIEQELVARTDAGTRDSLLRLFTRPLFTRPFTRWAVAAVLAVVVAGVGGEIHYRRVQYENAQRERAEGEAAKQRLMLALRIAGSKLQLARSKVNQINASQNSANAGQSEN